MSVGQLVKSTSLAAKYPAVSERPLNPWRQNSKNVQDTFLRVGTLLPIDALIIRVSTSSILDVWAHDALCQAGEFVELSGIELILVAILTVVPILTPSRAQIKS